MNKKSDFLQVNYLPFESAVEEYGLHKRYGKADSKSYNYSFNHIFFSIINNCFLNKLFRFKCLATGAFMIPQRKQVRRINYVYCLAANQKLYIANGQHVKNQRRQVQRPLRFVRNRTLSRITVFIFKYINEVSIK